MDSSTKGLVSRLKDKEIVIAAEGYLFEFESRGYLKAGAFVPEIVIEHPDLVRVLHEEFVHAGSDVVEAFTYYGHREKLKLIGREKDVEELNRKALRTARDVANRTKTLMAGNVSNTTVYKPNDANIEKKIKDMFKEQIIWAAEEKADFIIGETFSDFEEALWALQAIQQHGNGLPSVITLTPMSSGKTSEGMSVAEACRRLEESGATVVGLNCYQGPDTIIPLIQEVRKSCTGPIACLPSPYRTSEQNGMSFMDMKNPSTGGKAFPGDLDYWRCSRSEIGKMTKQLLDIGVQYMGLCCGNQAHYTRAMSEAIGRKPPASKYSPDMSQHFSHLTDEEHAYNQSAYWKLTSWENSPKK